MGKAFVRSARMPLAGKAEPSVLRNVGPQPGAVCGRELAHDNGVDPLLRWVRVVPSPRIKRRRCGLGLEAIAIAWVNEQNSSVDVLRVVEAKRDSYSDSGKGRRFRFIISDIMQRVLF